MVSKLSIESTLRQSSATFRLGAKRFINQHGIRANSVFQPVTFNAHGFFSEEISVAELHLFLELFHENRFALYRGGLQSLSKHEFECFNKIEAVYRSLHSAATTEVVYPRPNSALFCILWLRFLRSFRQLGLYARPSRVFEIGPGNLKLACWLSMENWYQNEHVTLENCLSLFQLQSVVKANATGLSLDQLSVDGFYNYHFDVEPSDVVVANHCLNELDPAALRFYLSGVTAPILGIGLGGKRYFSSTLAVQYRELLKHLFDLGFFLSFYVSATPGTTSTELTFFVFTPRVETTDLKVFIDNRSQQVALDRYGDFVDVFDPFRMNIVQSRWDVDKSFFEPAQPSQRDVSAEADSLLDSLTKNYSLDEKFIRTFGLKR